MSDVNFATKTYNLKRLINIDAVNNLQLCKFFLILIQLNVLQESVFNEQRYNHNLLNQLNAGLGISDCRLQLNKGCIGRMLNILRLKLGISRELDR